jgi:hypothetical protein
MRVEDVNIPKARSGILAAVSDWLKLLALIVLVAEAVILIAMRITPSSNPLTSWYPVFMLLFLIVVVVGVFWDRYTQRSTALTLTVSDRKVSVETSDMTVPTEEMKRYDIDAMFVDSQNGFMFPKFKSQLWSKPQYLSSGELFLKFGLIQDLDAIEEAKKGAAVLPLGTMMIESRHLLFEEADPIECQLTDETSNPVAETTIQRMIALLEKDGKGLNEEQVRELRKALIRRGGGSDKLKLVPEQFKVHNTFSVSIFDKSLARESPIQPNLANVFLLEVKGSGETVDNLVANTRSILWGSSQTLTNVMVKGKLRELTTYRMSNLVESDERLFKLQISFSPQTESSIAVWEELKEVFDSFRMIV